MSAPNVIDVEDDMSEQEKMNEELQFQDIPHVAKDTEDSQTHTFVNFPHSADSDNEESDKAELLKGEKKAPGFWTFDYYQQLFDVDTNQVLRRILGSMTPKPGRNYLKYHIRPKPDLYGPFWICTTLVFTTAIAGNLANYLQSANKDYKWRYNFQKVTFAATAIFSYWWLLPMVLFGIMWWRRSQANYSFLEIISVYGYSLAIYIPISILWVIQVSWLQWLLVIVGTLLSGSVLLFTFWPAFREDSMKVAGPVMAGIFLFHAALAAGFVLYFFYVPTRVATLTPVHNITTSSTNLQGNLIPQLPSLRKESDTESNISLSKGMQNVQKTTRNLSKETRQQSPAKTRREQKENLNLKFLDLNLSGGIKQKRMMT